MHSNEFHSRFIALRARGLTLRSIAEQLGVHRNTLRHWQQQHREQVDHLRLLELEAMRERALAPYEQELDDVADEYRRVTAELRTRECSRQPTVLLARRQLDLLALMHKVRTQLSTKRTIPTMKTVPSPCHSCAEIETPNDAAFLS